MLASCIYLKEFEMKIMKKAMSDLLSHNERGKMKEKKMKKKMKKWKVKINRLGAGGTGWSFNFTNS